MSRRFGRNQRRRAREAIAELAALSEQTATLFSRSCQEARELRAEIARFRRLMSRHWIGFEPLWHGEKHKDDVVYLPDVPIQATPRIDEVDISESLMMRSMPLDVMASHCDLDELRQQLHVVVRYADGTAGYAISRKAMHSVPRDELRRIVASALADTIVLKPATTGSRYV